MNTYVHYSIGLNTEGIQFVSYCFNLFDRLPLHQLIPDTTQNIIVSDGGQFGNIDYICTARAYDASFYVMYIPAGCAIYVNLVEMSDKRMRVHWYNPRTGKSIRIGHVGGDPRFGIVAPDDNDWLLIFDCVPEWQMP
ncbi:MAG: hypothetical protein IPL46_29175 [Saprospiraceae bacterium]|nr:hypothetical protein [Saprospiraceae bacterium]